jgi:hypothetical protein
MLYEHPSSMYGQCPYYIQLCSCNILPHLNGKRKLMKLSFSKIM